MKDYYLILGVNKKASAEEIKKAYAHRVRIVHPDRFEIGSDDWKNANEMLQEMNEAYACLKNPDKRKQYDFLFYVSSTQPTRPTQANNDNQNYSNKQQSSQQSAHSTGQSQRTSSARETNQSSSKWKGFLVWALILIAMFFILNLDSPTPTKKVQTKTTPASTPTIKTPRTPISPTDVPPKITGIVVAETSNYREKPLASAKRLGSFNKGSVLTIHRGEESSENRRMWYYVTQESAGGQHSGWISGNLIKINQDPSAPLLPITPPSSRVLLNTTGKSGIAPFSVQTNEVGYYLIKLVEIQTGKIVEIFTRADQNRKFEIPLGTYKLRYAFGYTWYGREHLFGSGTIYTESDSILKFEKVGTQVRGYTVTLYKVAGGNMHTRTIDASKF